MKQHTIALHLYLVCFVLSVATACGTDNTPPTLGGSNPSSAGIAMLAATGQDTCYNTAGTLIDCAATGQDGELLKGVASPAPRFTDNGDGTVTDNLTGLMWIKEADCSNLVLGGPGLVTTWGDGLNFIQNVNNGTHDCGNTVYNDWRLPNIRELQSIQDFRFFNPALPNSAGTAQMTTGDPFNEPTDDLYMSSTSYVPDPENKHWVWSRLSGSITPGIKVGGLHGIVWPVRNSTLNAPAPVPATGQTICYKINSAALGPVIIDCATSNGQDGQLLEGVGAPSPRFTDNGNGTVSDNLSGLVWMKDANCIGNILPGLDSDGTAGDGKVAWQHGLDFIGGLNYGAHDCGNSDGYTDWRLPNYRELNSLINLEYSEPAISNSVGDAKWTEGDPFTGIPADYDQADLATNNYWSSTTSAQYKDGAWVVKIATGVNMPSNAYAYIKKDANNYYVWPVRGGN